MVAYEPTPLVLFNNDGHTIEVEYEEGSTLTVGATEWEVRQFHFHIRSEHRIGGQDEEMEMHVVHRSASGASAVLGVRIREGAENAELAPVFAHLRATPSEPEAIAGEEIDLARVLPANLSAWRYDGSLTTPPCTEGVRWHVLAETIELSAEQIAAYRAIFPRGARPTQPLGDRGID